MMKKLRWFNTLLIIVLLISACNMPKGDNNKNASGTAAAQTVQAMLSATPMLIPITMTPGVPTSSLPPTLTPIPLPVNTNTPIATATPNCNVSQFITDVTVPDGTVFTPGQAFTKKWRIKNIGACAWNGFSLVFDSGDAMGAPATNAIAVVNPNQEVDLAVNMTAPTTPGKYRGYWRIVTSGNVLVPVVGGAQSGKSFYVDIKVESATPSPTNTTVAPAFAVTGVSFTNGGTCGAFTVVANVTANGAGTVTYHFVRSDGATDGTAHAPIVFSSAGTQPSETYTWSVTASGTYWVDIFIDTPNHQQFAHSATLTCP